MGVHAGLGCIPIKLKDKEVKQLAQDLRAGKKASQDVKPSSLHPTLITTKWKSLRLRELWNLPKTATQSQGLN